MGDTKPTTRTLADGSKVTHYPDGRQVLQPTNSLSAALGEQIEDQEAASAELRDKLVEAAIAKNEAMGSGEPVPTDKRAV